VRIISELIDGGGYDDPGPVKDAAERQILAIPFSQFRDSALAGALFHQRRLDPQRART
jgi:hypothetical protein